MNSLFFLMVLEDPETQETREVPKKTLPKGAKEGAVLTEDDTGALQIDQRRPCRPNPGAVQSAKKALICSIIRPRPVF